MDLIEEVKNQIKNIHEPEMGDFRRRSALYINRLAEQVDKDQKKLAKVHEIREKILYQHFEHTEDLSELILEHLNQI